MELKGAPNSQDRWLAVGAACTAIASGGGAISAFGREDWFWAVTSSACCVLSLLLGSYLLYKLGRTRRHRFPPPNDVES